MAPTLQIVDKLDKPVIELNRRAMAQRHQPDEQKYDGEDKAEAAVRAALDFALAPQIFMNMPVRQALPSCCWPRSHLACAAYR